MIRFMVLALCLISAPAFAHVTANPNTATAGKYFEAGFRVSHGCDGSPTTSVTISLPAGMVSVKPQYKPGWTITIEKSKLDKPVPAGHGKMASEQFDTITWSGASLPDDQYDTFGLLMKLPEDAGILWFPVMQVCKDGVEEWKNVPANVDAWHDTDHPAPFIRLNRAAKTGHQH